MAGGHGGARPNAGRKPKPKGEVPAEPKRGLVLNPAAMQVIADVIEKSAGARGNRNQQFNPFQLPAFPKNAMPPAEHKMAMDQFEGTNWAAAEWAGAMMAANLTEGMIFPGYAYLAELAQRPEYRIISEIIADDATRKWIDFDVVGDKAENKRKAENDPAGESERMADPDERKKRVDQSGKADKVKALKDDQARLDVRDKFYALSRDDGFFGRTHLFVDLGIDINDNSGELVSPIGDGRDAISKGKIAIGSLRRIHVVEPAWVYPTTYNATNPLHPDWYNPQVWYVMGKQIHRTRLLTFVSSEVPDMLKPAYAFGGLSRSQLAKSYVDIWLKTRESIGELIHSFSVMVLCTDLATLLQPGGADALLARVALFNALRDNQGTFVVNKTTEDFKNVSASLAGLHELQSQAQEHMASVVRIPLVKFTGITPAGLNASSDGEIKVYDDTIAAYQNRFFRPHLTRVINFEQLSLWGEVDPEITFRFETLRELTDKERSEKEKADAERDQIYVDGGALAPEEVRKRIIDDPDLPYADLDPEDVPDLLAEEEQGLVPGGKKPGGEGGPGGSPDGEGGGQDAAIPFAIDEASFQESKHPRDQIGEFTSGGGSSALSKAAGPKLSPTEKAYIDSYSGDDFLRLNGELRAGKDGGPAASKLDSAIAKSSIPAGTRLYRGMSRDGLKKLIQGDEISVGQTLSDKGFLSTSTDQNIAGMNGIGGVVLQIDVGEGQKGLDMAKLTRNEHEKEVLLPRNSKLKIAGIRAPKQAGQPIIVRVVTES